MASRPSYIYTNNAGREKQEADESEQWRDSSLRCMHGDTYNNFIIHVFGTVSSKITPMILSNFTGQAKEK